MFHKVRATHVKETKKDIKKQFPDKGMIKTLKNSNLQQI